MRLRSVVDNAPVYETGTGRFDSFRGLQRPSGTRGPFRHTAWSLEFDSCHLHEMISKDIDEVRWTTAC